MGEFFVRSARLAGDRAGAEHMLPCGVPELFGVPTNTIGGYPIEKYVAFRRELTRRRLSPQVRKQAANAT